MDVILLSLMDGGCGAASSPRVPVLACRDALRAAGASAETVEATADADIDAVVERLAAAADGVVDPTVPRLVVAASGDGELRAVLRRLVRRYAPAPSQRPADLPPARTIPDLPPVGVLPLDPIGTPSTSADDLAGRLGLPRDPAAVAAAVLGGRTRRLDLLRTDAGSVTLHGSLLGGADEAGRVVSWRGRVEVDDAVLSDGTEALLACAVVNGTGYAELDGLPLAPAADPADGAVDVAVALPGYRRGVLGRRRTRIEVRRASGRAVAVTPHDDDVPYLDDGVVATLSRKRTWWIEAGAWAVYI